MKHYDEEINHTWTYCKKLRRQNAHAKLTKSCPPKIRRRVRNSKNSTWHPNYYRSLPCLCLHFSKLYEKKVKMSNLLAIEVDFTFTQKQSPKNSKKKGKKFKMGPNCARWRKSHVFDSHFVFAAHGLNIVS